MENKTLHHIFEIAIGISFLLGFISFLLYRYFRGENRFANRTWKKDFEPVYKIFLVLSCVLAFIFWLVILGHH